MSKSTVAPRAFRAVVMKELRVTARLAILGAIITSFCLLVPLIFSLGSLGPNLAQIIWVLDVVAPIAGLAFGAATILTENRGDQLGFLLHRPMTRSAIFFAKTIAGLLLFLASVGVPLALLTAWAAAPGSLAHPFSLLLLRTAAVDLALGVTAFFVALLCTMREARWFGTRWIALAAPYPLFVGVYSVSEFWMALVITGAAALVLGTAAWGTFLAAGGYERQPLPGRLATGLSVGSGIAMAGLFVLAFAVSVLYDLFPRVFEESPDERSVSFEITSAGPVRVTRRNGSIDSIIRLDGTTMDRSQMELLVNAVREYSLDVGVPAKDLAVYRRASDVYTRLLRTPQEQHDWFYLNREGVLAGYDKKTRRRVGWVGPGGSAEPNAGPPAGFAEPLLHDGSMPMVMVADSARVTVRLLVFPSVVYAFDPAAQSITLLFRAQQGDTIRQATPGDGGRLVVATNSALYVRSAEGSVTALKHVGHLLRQVTLYRIVGDVPREMYVRYYGSDSAGASTAQLVRFSPNGDEAERYPVSVTPQIGYVVVGKTQGILEATRPFAMQLVHPQPMLRGSWDGSAVHHRGWFTSLLLLMAALSAAATLVLSRRHAFSASRTTTWALLGLSLGPVGVLMMLSLVEWPQRERCPACGKQRVVIRDRCEHCTRGFTPPEKDGTEILELSPVHGSS